MAWYGGSEFRLLVLTRSEGVFFSSFLPAPLSISYCSREHIPLQHHRSGDAAVDWNAAD